ncbi:TonB-dependent receptor [Parabacteroides sp. 52]|uniref:TonB-dependent receptor plug domain-containing protein n=1 Tax=unclassified Parabacteroides TaxID=2649774 RepID=UPI0013D0C849|nr:MULTISPECIES: TonB-dependent receptor [unclassified Parabacteroides]MDH6535254.1 outer membrane cobalamin receptor [Parabacteroides sp. PM5-20]NDV55817.1 TonB-dependent receptor [Parabacteroides sp. 52]
MKRGLCVACMAFLCLSFSIYATENEPEVVDSLVNLKGVVVSANRIKVNRNSVPLSISVIERNEIEGSSESALLPVLSHRVPGLFVTQKGITGFGVSGGSAGTVNIRGVGQGNKVLMLFDGQPQWAGVFGHALPDTYVASDVERVEVIRGPGSLLYGSNAMGGVVNIITRQQDRVGRRTQVRMMYGSYNTQKYMINNGYNVGGFRSFVSVNHDRTDGHRPHSAFHITNGFANLGYRFNEKYKVKGDISLAKYKTQNPGTVESPMQEHVMHILRGTASLGFENTFDKSSGAVQAFYNWGNHKINDGYPMGGQPRSYLFRSDDHNRGVLLYQSFRPFEGNSFTAGVDYKNWGGHAWNDTIQGTAEEIVDKTVDELALYLILQQELFGKVSLHAGMRYEYNSAYGNQWIPQAGITFRLFDGNAIKASFSKGFRSPTLRELYISYLPYSKANPDLTPENMVNYEVSVGQYFFENRFHGEITGFYMDGKDMIQPVKGELTNIGKFYHKGVEVEASYHPLRNFVFTANYSYLHTNKVIIAAPKHAFFIEGICSVGRFTATVNLQSIYGLYPNTSVETPEKENYTLLNARLAYKLGDDKRFVNFFVKGENLTAARYMINDGFPMPKATLMGGIDFTF